MSVTTRDLPSFCNGDGGRHHHLAGFHGGRFIGAVIHWFIGQRVEGWAPFNLVRFAIEFPHPSPVDGLTILTPPSTVHFIMSPLAGV
jgi:hypothetical protein